MIVLRSMDGEHGLSKKEPPVVLKAEEIRLKMMNIRKLSILNWILRFIGYEESAGQPLKAQKSLDAILTSSPGVLYRLIINAAGEREDHFISDTCERMYGIKAENMTNLESWNEWFEANVDSKSRAQLSTNREKLFKDGVINSEFRFRGPDRTWRWARDHARAIHKPDGSYEIVGYCVDITDEKDRAISLAQSSKLATLGEMATGMAHELYQPLAGISLAAENALLELQSDMFDAAKVERKLTRISELALRAATLVDHMRVFGRREPDHSENAEVSAALRGALIIVEGQLRSTGVSVQQSVEQDLPTVNGSVMLIEQVLINIIANACDAYKEKKPVIPEKLRIIGISLQKVGGMVRIVVADKAGGIQETDLDHVFEPFFTTKIIGQGTGLGLSISYGIISDMGGAISVRNENGGAIFEINLPISSEPANLSV